MIFGDAVFGNPSPVKTLNILPDVTNIAASQFNSSAQGREWTAELTALSLPTSLQEIGDGAFYQCTGILSNIDFSGMSGLTTIEQSAFWNTGITGAIVFPTSLQEIGNNAFYNCPNIISIEFPVGSQLNTIENGAFGACGNLTELK